MRGLPTDPPARLSERMRALPYFVNNLAPSLRDFWIHYTDRVRISECTRDDLARIAPQDPVPPASPESPTPRAVVLNSTGILLGTIETLDSAARAVEAMNPAPQTIRPDMTLRLAAQLMKSNPSLLVTAATGKYLGRYVPA